MKKILLALVFLFALNAQAQTPGVSSSGNITASGATCGTTNACITLYFVPNVSGVSVTVSGTYSGTLQFEQSADNGANWSAASPSSTTSTGIFSFPLTALTAFRVRASAFASGTATIFINSSTAAGGGNVTAASMTTHGVVVASGSQSITSTTAGTAGQVLTSNGASADPTFQAATGSVTTIASGTATMNTNAISSGSCDTVVTVAATGVATTDTIMADFNADPTSTVGYQPLAMLTIVKYPTANNVNFKVCNNTPTLITPGAAVVLNWRVLR